MFQITVETSFNAQHQIDFKGIGKEDLHSHDWSVKVAVLAEKLDENGLGIDFHDLKAKTEEITRSFTGKNLENLPPFEKINASAENVAKYIYEKLESTFPKTVQLQYVEITEEIGCKVRYFK